MYSQQNEEFPETVSMVLLDILNDIIPVDLLEQLEFSFLMVSEDITGLISAKYVLKSSSA